MSEITTADGSAAGPRSGAVRRLGLNVQEGADCLGVSRNTMSALIASGRIRAVRVGRRLIIDVAAIERFLAEASDE